MDPLGHCEAAAAAFPNNRILLPVELAVAKFQHQEKGDSGVDASLEGVLSTPAITIYVMGPVQANLTLTSDGRVRAVPMRASALPAGASTKGGAGLAPWKGDVSAADDELGNYWASFDKWCARRPIRGAEACPTPLDPTRSLPLLLLAFSAGPPSPPRRSISATTAPSQTRPPVPARALSAAAPARPATCSTRNTRRRLRGVTTSSGRAGHGTSALWRPGQTWSRGRRRR